MESSKVFVGREKEISEFSKFLEKSDNPVFVVIGEPGIGKSSFLKEIRDRIRMSSKDKMFVGFHEIVYRTDNVASPFLRALDDLMESLSASFRERMKEEARRLLKVGKKVFSEKGREMAKSVFKALAVKLLGEEAVKEFEKAIEEWRKTPSIFSFVEEKFSKYREDFVYDFVSVLKELLDEYKELKFVFVIDQFERAPQPSCEMLLGMVRMKPEGVYVAVSFKVEKEGTTRYESIRSDLLGLRAKILELPSLSEKEIEEWILKVRKMEFSYPELKRIKKLSGGFPLVISDWLQTPGDLSLDKLHVGREGYCELVKWRFDKLSKDCSSFLRNISVLTAPLSIDGYTDLTRIGIRECISHLEELERNWIFCRLDDTFWFRHELIKPCVEKRLATIEKEEYHKIAAEFFENKLGSPSENGAKVAFSIAFGCAYHFHHLGNHEKSLSYNSEVASFCFDRGLWDIAEECYLRAFEAALRLGKEHSMMVVRGNLARVYERWGRLDEAYKVHSEALEYFKKKKDMRNVSAALHQLAIIAQAKGNFGEAKKLYEEDLEISKDIGDKSGVGKALHHLAMIEDLKGNYDEAIKFFEEGLKISKDIGDKSGVAAALHHLAMIEEKKGNYEKARKFGMEGLKIEKEIGDRSGISRTIILLGGIEYSRGNYDEAIKFFEEGLKISKDIGDKSLVGKTLHYLAMVEQAKGNFGEAKKFCEEGLKIALNLGDKYEIASLYGISGILLMNTGYPEEAIEYFSKAAQIFYQLGSPRKETAMDYIIATIPEISEEKYQQLFRGFPEEIQKEIINRVKQLMQRKNI